MLSHFNEVFAFDADAWSPRKAVYAVAAHWAEVVGRPVPSTQEVYAALRARGFRETKRRGTYGFNGIYVADDVDTAPPLDTHGTARSYKAGCRCDRCKDAIYVEHRLRRVSADEFEHDAARVYDPFRVEAAPAELTGPAFALPPEAVELQADGYSRSTRVPAVLRSRAESRWGDPIEWSCAYCGSTASTVDHITPWSMTHDSRASNLAPCCSACQASKGKQLLGEWGPRRGLSSERIAELLAAN